MRQLAGWAAILAVDGRRRYLRHELRTNAGAEVGVGLPRRPIGHRYRLRRPVSKVQTHGLAVAPPAGARRLVSKTDVFELTDT
jgi:hypothetical protein